MAKSKYVPVYDGVKYKTPQQKMVEAQQAELKKQATEGEKKNGTSTSNRTTKPKS